MTDLGEMSDHLHRTAKLALDTGEAATLADAERIFAGYTLQIVLGHDVVDSTVLQAAALTAVNCAARTFLGGVTVVGATGPLRVQLPPHDDLASAVTSLEGRLQNTVDPSVPTLVIGDAAIDQLEPLAVRATFAGWSAGVVPAAASLPFEEQGDFTPAGVLAAAIGVSEVFQRLRGRNPRACRRAIGLNLWRPEQDWRVGDHGPALQRLPSSAWLVGLGNLGQAYLWTLNLLPCGDLRPHVVLQDLDFLARSNLSTSLLTSSSLLSRRKTRVMAEWAEERGFTTAIIERSFAPDFKVAAREPNVALVGVDNALARQAIDTVGFERVIEAGLGRGVQDYLGIDLHTFPASVPASEIWREVEVTDADLSHPAYRALLEATGDQCGTVRLAGRSIGAPFVGAAAASLVVSELLRMLNGGRRYEVISCHLRDLDDRAVVPGDAWAAFNPGAIPVAA